MINKKDKNADRLIRHKRVRKSVNGTSERPRLSVYRSANHIYAQVIDDIKGVTLVSSSTLVKEIAVSVPSWDPTKCIQCNQCSLVCPHACIRPVLSNAKHIINAEF